MDVNDFSDRHFERSEKSFLFNVASRSVRHWDTNNSMPEGAPAARLTTDCLNDWIAKETE